MHLDDDLEAIFDSDDFDNACATFTLSDGTTLKVKGWFTESTQSTNILTQEVETLQPTFTVQTSKITAVKRGISVEIDDETLTVERIEKVGTGCSLLYLKTDG